MKMYENAEQDSHDIEVLETGSDQQIQNTTPVDYRNLFGYVIGGLVVILLIYPWLLFFCIISFALGYSISSNLLNQQLRPFILKRIKAKSPEPETYDPLLHPPVSVVPSPCSVCQLENCSRARDFHNREKSMSSFKVQNDVNVDSSLDSSIARFCSAVFSTFIIPLWAPYESRRQLRQTLAKVLIAFIHKIKEKFASNERSSILFIQEKALPLLLHHLNQKDVKLTKEQERSQLLKVRNCSRLLIQEFLPNDDGKCKLWVELCVSVLGDGVFWNLILLGRKEIPLILQNMFETRIDREDVNQSPSATENKITESKEVALLLDSFVDPVHDVEQCPSIVSRWRPTLVYIRSESERNLLYCLIQFLRHEGALEYLQAVLDETPDAHSYAKKVLELLHIQGFCRSKIFLENLGFSRVEPAFEVNPDLLRPSSGKSHHNRSNSYGGGVGSGLLEQRVVEGFAIYPPVGMMTITSIPTTHISQLVPDSESIFKRRHPLEFFIQKFYASIYPPKDPLDILDEPIPKRREGIDVKNLETSPLEQIEISSYNFLKSSCYTVFSRMKKNSWQRAVLIGWSNFLYLFLQDRAATRLAVELKKRLRMENIIFFIDFITDAFLLSQVKDSESKEERNKKPLFGKSVIPSWLFEGFVDQDEILESFTTNSDSILLFFVDLLQLLVSELLSETT